MNKIFQLLLNLIWMISILFVIYGSYFLFFSIFGLVKKKKDIASAEPRNRFLIVIAARNEGLVIGNLIDSLMNQNYPRALFDVLVVPNNCSDQTSEIARQHGARVMECSVPIKSKGAALSFAFQNMPADLTCDAYCIFDADNVVHPDFLLHMNNALCSGAVVAQGYRDTKNPYDTYNSGGWAINYWMGCRFYNHPRSLLNLSANIHGTGFMASAELIKRMGGWKTFTLAEDYEFTMQCILAGEKVAWVPEAITYDEQSLTIGETWKQRKRWTIGFLQVLSIYFTDLVQLAAKTKSMVCVDFVIYSLRPAVQYLSYLLFPFGVILRMLVLKYPLFPLTPLYDQFFQSLGVSVFVPIIVAFIVVLAEKKLHIRLLKSILAFPFFIAIQIPISIVSFVVYRTNYQWDEIRHTRAIRIEDMKQLYK